MAPSVSRAAGLDCLFLCCEAGRSPVVRKCPRGRAGTVPTARSLPACRALALGLAGGPRLRPPRPWGAGVVRFPLVWCVRGRASRGGLVPSPRVSSVGRLMPAWTADSVSLSSALCGPELLRWSDLWPLTSDLWELFAVGSCALLTPTVLFGVFPSFPAPHDALNLDCLCAFHGIDPFSRALGFLLMESQYLGGRCVHAFSPSVDRAGKCAQVRSGVAGSQQRSAPREPACRFPSGRALLKLQAPRVARSCSWPWRPF